MRKYTKIWRERISEAMKGNKNGWKGGRRKKSGYIQLYLPKHPFSDKSGCIFEHRVVMEKSIGRYLNSKEFVHHINGIRDDNRAENLEMVTSATHRGKVIRIRCPHCNKEFQIRH